MTYEANSGLGVSNHYGPRDSGKTRGIIKTEGSIVELSVMVEAEDIGSALFLEPTIPAGALIVGAFAKVSEAFALGGTTPTIDVGTKGSEATNAVNLTEAQAEAVGTYDIFSTAAGTWAASLAADTIVGVALGGTTPTVGAAGKLEVIIQYTQVAV
ncbi:hypothetical protein N9924_00765 [bacterium]|nr:hypothetical protein [bacterium]